MSLYLFIYIFIIFYYYHLLSICFFFICICTVYIPIPTDCNFESYAPYLKLVLQTVLECSMMLHPSFQYIFIYLNLNTLGQHSNCHCLFAVRDCAVFYKFTKKGNLERSVAFSITVRRYTLSHMRSSSGLSGTSNGFNKIKQASKLQPHLSKPPGLGGHWPANLNPRK